MPILKYKADRRTLLFIGSYFVLTATLWNIWTALEPLSNLTPPALAGFGAAVAALCVLSWIAAVITHNTLHAPIFKTRFLNQIFQVILTVTYGFPVSEYVPGHNLSHHQFTQKPQDVMRTGKANLRWNLLNFLYFVPRVAPDVTRANMKFMRFMKDKNSGWYRQYLIELSVCWGSKFALLALDWQKALLLIFLPHAFALWGITAVNYLQHDGCDEDHEFNHSRNFTGRLFNWFTFNNGFHGMHHRKPGLHWSLLREAHSRELSPGIHPALEQPSLAIYLWRAFIYPGKRIRYDGSPVQFPVEQTGPDQEWIKTSKENELQNVILENNLGGGIAVAQ